VHHSGGEAVVAGDEKMGFAGKCLADPPSPPTLRLPPMLIASCAPCAIFTGQEDPVHHSGGEAVTGEGTKPAFGGEVDGSQQQPSSNGSP
jgi:hypothetical protein